MSKPLVVNIPHDLGRIEARKRLQDGFGRIQEQIGGKGLAFEERWEGDRLYFNAGALGQKVSGQVDVEERNVRIEIELPWLLAAIAGQLQGRVQKEAQLLLGGKQGK
ncbi:MAG: hypothetical protein JWL90_4415 [Chthoniobacteraceae bacterium]|nr:hypothetical protein [Chthoniobacteraceae bacterium]MDB6174019.1 hypothetical protein [Chthoniobacteraceae bacterium]